MSRLSLEIKIRIVILKAKFESVSLVRRELQKEFRDIPTDKTIRKIYEKFCVTGSVDELPHDGRPKKYNENDIHKSLFFQINIYLSYYFFLRTPSFFFNMC